MCIHASIKLSLSFSVSLISSMLQKDPSCRASLEEVEAHQWLQGLDNALLSPEAPPHWLSGALSPISLRPGVPESGDLLAARPPPQKAWRPSLKLSPHPPPPEEPPVVKTLAALQQICEEEEEEEEDSLIEEGEGLSSRPSLMAECSHLSSDPEKTEKERADDQEEYGEKEEPRIGSAWEVMEEEEEKMEMEIGAGESGHVISDQPSSDGHKPVSQTSEVPPPPLPGLGVQCCHGKPDPTTPEGTQEDETELNNNTNKTHPGSRCLSVLSLPLPSPRISLNGKEAQRTGSGRKQEEGERDDLQTDRSQPHNALGSQDAGSDAAPRVEAGKRHSIKLRERLFQFPLCEKALAFNIPTHKKSKILPLAQYNCCHVL